MHFATGVDRLIGKIAIWIVIALLVFGFRLLRARAAKWWMDRRTRIRNSAPLPPPVARVKSGNAVLRGVSGHYAGAVVPLGDGPVFLGRDPKANNLVFPADFVAISLRHCMVKYERGGFWLQDLSSSSGTHLESGLSVAPGQPCALETGARFYLGDPIHMFEVGYA